MSEGSPGCCEKYLYSRAELSSSPPSVWKLLAQTQRWAAPAAAAAAVASHHRAEQDTVEPGEVTGEVTGELRPDWEISFIYFVILTTRPGSRAQP